VSPLNIFHAIINNEGKWASIARGKKRGVRSDPIIFLDVGLGLAGRRIRNRPTLSVARPGGETRRDDNASLQAGGLLCERGWGVSLRSTTCKGMVTVPGGELRCTGNLCSERHSRPEVGERLLDHKPLAKHRLSSQGNKKKEMKNRTNSRISHTRPMRYYRLVSAAATRIINFMAWTRCLLR